MSKEYWLKQIMDTVFDLNLTVEELEEKIEEDDEIDFDDLIEHLDFRSKELTEAITELKDHYVE